MDAWEQLPTRAILDQMPPIEKAPILERLAQSGLKKFREEEMVSTPINLDQTVSHIELVETMRQFVDPDYRWQAPFFDEHHLHWQASLYDPSQHEGDIIPSRFRDLATQKIWVPRQFHNFIHVMTEQPPVPDRDVMRAHIDKVRRLQYMYRLATEAISLGERHDRSVYYPNQELVVDSQTRRSYRPDVLESQRQRFIERLERSFAQGLPPDLEILSILELVEQQSVDGALLSIRRKLGDVAVCRSTKRRARAVHLPIEQPTAA